MTGLNPHCETSNNYSEEKEILEPAIKQLIKKNIKISGPFPADTLFIKKNLKKFDVVIGMYHDQVLTPIKTIYEFKAINITLGLPFLRITPDHGPNNDMLGKNLSNPELLKNELVIFGNLPYNISSQILVKLIINKEKFHIKKMIFMFQKELADRIISDENSKNYGRLSVLAKWKFNINKVIDISPNSFLPKPKVKSTLLLFSPKDKILKLKKPENLEYVTRVFFNQRRKKIKKPLNVLFQNKTEIINKLNLDLNLRPQNLSFKTFFDITKEYEKLVR